MQSKNTKRYLTHVRVTKIKKKKKKDGEDNKQLELLGGTIIK